MEILKDSLESILQQHFWVVPARTNRNDQWYKRSYQGWKDEHGDCEPVILAPRTSRAEWAAELHVAAVLFAKNIDQEARHMHKQQDPASQTSQDKVFADDVFALPLGVLGYDCKRTSPLKPAMQRATFWMVGSQNTHDEREIYQHAIKALLACEQTKALCFLARHAHARIKNTATMEVSVPCSSRRLDVGWDSIIDEILELCLALIILKCFPQSLPLEAAYQTWVPFVFAAHTNVTTAERIKCLSYERKGFSTEKNGADETINHCYRILVVTQVLMLACDMPAVNWEQRFASAALHFVGFECWNREREGQSYLGCDLNVRKDGAWLQKMTNIGPLPDRDAPNCQKSRSSDPLLLHDPKRRDTIASNEEGDDIFDDLAIVEAQEISYGRKRSTKYRKRAYGGDSSGY